MDLAGRGMREVHVSFHTVRRQLRPGVPGGGEAGMGENTHGVIGTHLRCCRLVAASQDGPTSSLTFHTAPFYHSYIVLQAHVR